MKPRMKPCKNCGTATPTTTERPLCLACTSDAKRTSNLRHRYGIDDKEYNELLDAQDGCCQICSIHWTATDGHLVVDHCHETLSIRGLLCQSCNKALGLFSDSPMRLRRAMRYLGYTTGLHTPR